MVAGGGCKVKLFTKRDMLLHWNLCAIFGVANILLQSLIVDPCMVDFANTHQSLWIVQHIFRFFWRWVVGKRKVHFCVCRKVDVFHANYRQPQQWPNVLMTTAITMGFFGTAPSLLPVSHSEVGNLYGQLTIFFPSDWWLPLTSF